MLAPYRLDTKGSHRPIANWTMVSLCVLVFLLERWGVSFEGWVLYDWNAVGLAGHMFLHGGFVHLAGNMLFLIIFGNAACAKVGNSGYAILFLIFGVLAGAGQLLLGDETVGLVGTVGASGAINGVIGLVVALFPRNRADVFYFLFVVLGTATWPVWFVVLLWLGFDLWGLLSSTELTSVAYGAHVGGMAAGILLGLVLIRLRWIDFNREDAPNLLEVLTRRRSG